MAHRCVYVEEDKARGRDKSVQRECMDIDLFSRHVYRLCMWFKMKGCSSEVGIA